MYSSLLVLVLLLSYLMPVEAASVKQSRSKLVSKLKLELKKSGLEDVAKNIDKKDITKVSAKGFIYIVDSLNNKGLIEEQFFFKSSHIKKATRVFFINNNIEDYLSYKEITIKGYKSSTQLFVTSVEANKNLKREARNLRSKSINIATVRVNFKDSGNQLSRETINSYIYGGKDVDVYDTPDGILGAYNSTKETYKLLSKNNLIITGSVIADITIDSSYNTNCEDDYDTWIEQIYTEIEKLGLSSQFNSADYRVFSMPGARTCSFGGVAFVGSGETIVINQDVSTYTHELGHLLGMSHASSNLPGENIEEYGDFSDVMGASGFENFRKISEFAKSKLRGSQSLNAPHRIQMGFLDPSRLTTISNQVNNTFTLSSLDIDLNTTQVIKINSLNKSIDYYLSFRTYDDELPITASNEYKVAIHTAQKALAPSKNISGTIVLLRLLDQGDSYVNDQDDLQINVESIDVTNNRAVVRIAHKSSKINSITIRNNNISFNWSGRFFEKWLYGSDGHYFITPSGELRKWHGGSKTSILTNSTLLKNYSPKEYTNLALLPGIIKEEYDNFLAAKNLVINNNNTHYNFSKFYKERWLKSSNDWYFILPDGTLYKWDRVSTGENLISKSIKVDALAPELYENPYLFKTITVDEYLRAMNFRLNSSKSISYNWSGTEREKWFYSNEGWCFIKHTDSSNIYRWDPSSGKGLKATAVYKSEGDIDYNLDEISNISVVDWFKAHKLNENKKAFNKLGLSEKSLNGVDGEYYILPNGDIYIYDPDVPPGAEKALHKFDTSYYNNPALLL